MAEKITYRGFTVGKIYSLNVNVTDEDNNIIHAGTLVRLVAIAPKVRLTTGPNKDSWMYFYNAVLANQTNDYGNRIRENFCTLKSYRNSK